MPQLKKNASALPMDGVRHEPPARGLIVSVYAGRPDPPIALGGYGRPFGYGSGADIMLAPIATRFQTYGVCLEGAAESYMGRILQDPLVAQWLGLGQQETDVIPSLEVGQ